MTRTASRLPARRAPSPSGVHLDLHPGDVDRARAVAVLHRELARAPLSLALSRLVHGLVPAPLLAASVQVSTAVGVPLLALATHAAHHPSLAQWMMRAAEIARRERGVIPLEAWIADAPVHCLAAWCQGAGGTEVCIVLAESWRTAEPLLDCEVLADLADTVARRVPELAPRLDRASYP